MRLSCGTAECPGIDPPDEAAGHGRGTINTRAPLQIAINMHELRCLERLAHQRLIDDACVPETGMMRAGVAHERERLDPAHQRVGKKA